MVHIHSNLPKAFLATNKWCNVLRQYCKTAYISSPTDWHHFFLESQHLSPSSVLPCQSVKTDNGCSPWLTMRPSFFQFASGSTWPSARHGLHPTQMRRWSGCYVCDGFPFPLGDYTVVLQITMGKQSKYCSWPWVFKGWIISNHQGRVVQSPIKITQG